MRIVNRLRLLINQLLDVPSADAEDARRRRLLNILLLCLVAFVFVRWLIVLVGLIPPPSNERLFYWSIPAALLGVALTFVLNRYLSGRAAVLLFLILLVAFVFTDDLEEVAYGRSLLALALPIVIASVLLRPYAGFVVAGLISLLVNVVGMGVLRGPHVFAVPLFFAVALVSWISARSTERALKGLRVVNRELDQRVAERTRDLRRRSVQLQTAAEVARDATSIFDVDELLDEAVSLISERFGFYHAGVFLVDEQTEYAVLRAASSEGGQRMIARGHKLSVAEEGIVGHVAGSGEPLVVLDVGKSAAHLINPDLLDTRSEMSLPMVSRGRVTGVLDVQSVRKNVFLEEDVAVLQTMADQLANAIESVRLYEEASHHVQELTALHNIDVAMISTLDLNEVLEIIYEQVSEVMGVSTFYIALYDEEKNEIDMRLVVDEGEPVGRHTSRIRENGGLTGWVIRNRQPLWIGDAERDELPVESLTLGKPMRSLMILPLIVRDQVVGVISAQSPEPDLFGEDDRRLFLGIAHQAAIAITNARLFEETRRRLAETRLLQEVMQAAASTLDFDEVLARTIETLHSTLGIDYLTFVLPDEQGNMVMHPSRIGYTSNSEEVRVKLDDSVSGRVYRSGEPQIIADVREEPRYFKGAPEVRSELAAPVKVADRVVAVLNVESARLGAFDEDDLRLFSAVAAQLGVVLENARLFEETERRLAETRLLQEVMQAVASTLDFDEVLARTIETLHRTLGIEYLSFVLPKKQGIGLMAHPSWIGYDDAVDVEDCIPMDESVCGRVYQSGEPQIIPDVREAPCYFGTVPEIRSELVVPVRVAERVIAVLDAESADLGAFDEGDLRLFSAIAAQLGVVLENARLFEETDRRLAETRLLQEVVQAAASTLDFDEVLARAVETLYKTLSVDYLTFVFPNEQGTELVLHPSWVGYDDSVDIAVSIPMDESVCGRVYQSGEPQIISDVREVAHYFEITPGTRSELAVPVKVSGRVVGVLDAESTRVGNFDEDDRRLFSAVAAQLSVVLENARFFEETRRHLAEAELVQEVMLAAASTLDFDMVLERAVKALNRSLSVDRLGFLLPGEAGDVLVSHPSLVGLAEAPFQVSVEDTLVGQAYRTGQAVLVRDLAQSARWREYAPEIHSVLAVPVRVGGRIVAVLHAESTQIGAFSEDELRLFSTIAGQLGVTLENARLYQKLEIQADELSQAYNDLQEIDRLRTQLVQNVSHELRTPLGLVKGYVELLAAGELGPVADSQRSALQIVRERISTLSRLINNLTVLQAMPREALVLTSVSLVEVIRSVLGEFRRSADEAGILFREELPEDLPPVVGDRERLELIFGHLVDNAIKFSPGGGPVTLRAWTDQGMVCVSVADSGVGIPPESIGHIFERFYQADGSTRRRFSGMGVGLALVWEIVEAHGGAVDVESEPGEGSKFTVSLPQAE